MLSRKAVSTAGYKNCQVFLYGEVLMGTMITSLKHFGSRVLRLLVLFQVFYYSAFFLCTSSN